MIRFLIRNNVEQLLLNVDHQQRESSRFINSGLRGKPGFVPVFSHRLHSHAVNRTPGRSATMGDNRSLKIQCYAPAESTRRHLSILKNADQRR